MKKTEKLLKILLYFQGAYYGLTALWAIFALDNFSRVTGHYGDAFEMHSISALALVLGVAFIYGANYSVYRRAAGWLLFWTALAIIIPELVYFEEIQSTLFAVDLIEEIIAALLALFLLKKR